MTSLSFHVEKCKGIKRYEKEPRVTYNSNGQTCAFSKEVPSKEEKRRRNVKMHAVLQGPQRARAARTPLWRGGSEGEAADFMLPKAELVTELETEA